MLVVGIAYIILGVIVWRYPGETVLGATVYIGVILLMTGFSYLGLAFGGIEKRGWYVAAGIIDIVIGAIILFNPIASASLLVLTIGLWFVFKGAMIFAESFKLRKSGYSLWWVNLIGGIIIMYLGWQITGKPLVGTMAVVAYVSVSLWVKGVVMITNAFGLKNLSKIESEVESAVA